MRICIIDYGVGNLNSIYTQIKKNYSDVYISNEEDKISNSDKLILPGVGSANFAMKKIREMKLDKVLEHEVLKKKKPILGICLGMQVFFENLYENGMSKGLQFKKGNVRKINEKFKNTVVPNIGWGKVNFKNTEIENFIGKYNNFYFCHSYYVDTDNKNYLAFLDKTSIPAATLKNNIIGVQFHPEKSSVSGELLLKWFIEKFNALQ